MNTKTLTRLNDMNFQNLNDIEDSVFPHCQCIQSTSIDQLELFKSMIPQTSFSDTLITSLFYWDKFYEVFKYHLFTIHSF